MQERQDADVGGRTLAERGPLATAVSGLGDSGTTARLMVSTARWSQESSGVLAPNDAGRTTIHMLATEFRPDAGREAIFGNDFVHDVDAERSRVSMAGQLIRQTPRAGSSFPTGVHIASE